MENVNIKLVEWFDQHFYKVCYKPIDTEGNEGEEIIEYIPSVTTKLGIIEKPFLATWRGDVGNREADLRMIEAQDRGSRIHAAWEVYTQGGAVIFNDYKRPVYTQQEVVDIENKFGQVYVLRNQGEMYEMTKLQKFLEMLKPITTISETTIYDLENKDAGTADNLFNVAEGDYLFGTKPIHLIPGWYVSDLKTGKSQGQVKKQMAAYARIVKSMGIIEPVGCLSIWTGAKNKGGIAGLSVDVMFEEDIAYEYAGYRLTADLWQRESGNLKPKVFDLPSIIFKEDLANDTKGEK
jgi:hypothetical protein